MSRESKYLTFEEDDHYEGKTKRIVIVSKRHLDILGEIRWYGAWRCYVLEPTIGTVWNYQCLEDVQDVIDDLMDKWRYPDAAE